MSQSPDDDQDDTSDMNARNNELAVMLDSGLSMSGKERHCVFLNTGADAESEGRFACISAVSGLDFPDDGRGVSVVDWDRDGDQDLWISNRNAPRVRYLRNDTVTDNNSIAFLLVGNGTTTSRDAIGARIELILAPKALDESTTEAGADETSSNTVKPSGETETDSNKLIKTLHAGEGFLSQSSRWIHFGLGKGAEIAELTVHWPGGESETYTGLAVNRRYQIHQGGKAVESPMQADPPPPPLIPSTPELPPLADRFRIPLVALVPMPDLPYIDSSGITKNLLSTADGGMLLVNCWSTSCIPCLKELQEFTDRAGDLRDAGINILALNLDEATGIEHQGDSPDAILKRMGFPFAIGYATSKVAVTLSTIHNVMTATGGELPVPTSFLIDGSGRLTAIYKGPVSVDTLIADKEHSSLPPWERFRRAANLPGLVVESEVLKEAIEKSDRFSRTRLASHLEEMGWAHAASIQYEALAASLPESEEKQDELANVFFERGILLARRNDWTRATSAFEASVESNPDSPKAHYNLGLAYQRMGQTQLAHEQYEWAIELQPKLIPAQANLARLLAKEKNWPQAAIHFEKVIQARPRDETSHYNLGVALAMQDKWKEAAEQFQVALKLRPDFSQARKYLERVKEKLQ
ncbi:MAG TPA: tetratricopeptide repeat protein [Pirellulales bacterium]|nr:tetratricopeptide repeat protein [Pirellulales bacterium]